tara:strand:- start:237 stop:1043 length:807 start_codon:yes stop_codon:yes gene_type:complete
MRPTGPKICTPGWHRPNRVQMIRHHHEGVCLKRALPFSGLIRFCKVSTFRTNRTPPRWVRLTAKKYGSPGTAILGIGASRFPATPRLTKDCAVMARTLHTPMTCPLCTTANTPLISTPVPGGPAEASVDICAACADPQTPPDHFRALASTMWSDDPALQVLAARTLNRLGTDWARDLADQLYLDDETRAWADNTPDALAHRDSNGAALANGDTVVLIKDLPVKGAGFTAKRGTAVHKITLVPDTPAHIEGRVEGQRIVILTEFVKKRG